MNKVRLTKEAYDKLAAELVHLKSARRAEVAEKLKKAIAQGDISENAEYDEAKDESAIIEGRIIELSQKLGNAEITEYRVTINGQVQLGSEITVKRPDGSAVSYRIVLPDDADADKNLISADSPIAKALLGHALGDSVSIEVPAGKFDLEITSVA